MLLFTASGGAWAPTATTALPGAPHTLHAAAGELFAGVGAQILALHAAVHCPDGDVRLAAAHAVAHAPRPLWHPHALAVLLTRGAHATAAAALRELLAVAKGLQAAPRADALFAALRAAAVDAGGLAAAFAVVLAAVTAVPAAPLAPLARR